MVRLHFRCAAYEIYHEFSISGDQDEWLDHEIWTSSMAEEFEDGRSSNTN